MKKVANVIILLMSIILINSCTINNFDKQQIELEKKTNIDFLNAFKSQEYDSLEFYFSKRAVAGERNFSELSSAFKQLVDSFGSINEFEFKKLNSHVQHKTGTADENTRKYIYFLTCSKGKTLQIDLGFDVHSENENINLDRKIDFFEIDIYDESK